MVLAVFINPWTWRLAALPLQNGDPEAALPIARKALDFRRRGLPADHPHIGFTLYNN